MEAKVGAYEHRTLGFPSPRPREGDAVHGRRVRVLFLCTGNSTRSQKGEAHLSERWSKHLSGFARRRFDYVITPCDRVREVGPEFPGHSERIHWSITDPAFEGDTDDESYPAFGRTAAEIKTRVRSILHRIRQRLARR